MFTFVEDCLKCVFPLLTFSFSIIVATLWILCFTFLKLTKFCFTKCLRHLNKIHVMQKNMQNIARFCHFSVMDTLLGALV